MAKKKKSYDLDVTVSDAIDKETMMGVVESAATSTGLYVSHVGGYSWVK